MLSASPLTYWFFTGFLHYPQFMKCPRNWAKLSSLFCVLRIVLINLQKTYFKTNSCHLLRFLNPHFHKPRRKLKTQPLKLCWSL